MALVWQTGIRNTKELSPVWGECHYKNWNKFLGVADSWTCPIRGYTDFEDRFNDFEDGGAYIQVEVTNREGKEAKVWGHIRPKDYERFLIRLVNHIPNITGIRVVRNFTSWNSDQSAHWETWWIAIKQGEKGTYGVTPYIHLSSKLKEAFKDLATRVEEINGARKRDNQKIREKVGEAKAKREAKKAERKVIAKVEVAKGGLELPKGEDMNRLNKFLGYLADDANTTKLTITVKETEDSEELWSFEGSFTPSKQMLVKNVLKKRFVNSYVSFNKASDGSFIYKVLKA